MKIRAEPLVTFAILTYNQIDFIEDSIKGAVSQDYPNLEIIISDDCSTDGTFERVKEIISNYKGKHTIRLNQTSENKCTLGHFFDVIDLATGELLVLSAGDDISKPNRVTETVKVWKKESAVGVFSSYELIDDYGTSINELYDPSRENVLMRILFKNEYGFDIHGASSAYDMKFVKSIPRIEGRFFFEDIFMSFMINIFDKKLSKITDSLVLYRCHSNSITNSKSERFSLSNVQAAENKSSCYAQNKHNLYVTLRDISKSISNDKVNNNLDTYELNKYINKLKIRSLWIEIPIYQRVFYMYKYRQDKDFFKWIIPRVLGLNTFSALKAVKVRMK